MNLAELQKKLNAAARLQPPDERVPYAFEKRIQALIAARAMPDRWAVWSRGLWRAAISCVLLAVVLGAISLLAPAAASSDGGQDLSQDFENTMLASADQGDNSLP
jgi:hypothetical protein